MPRIALLNQKGGVGKTTVALGLASAALARGRSVMVVDVDPQASATWALGLDGPTGLANALADGGSGAAKSAVGASTWSPDLSVVSAGADLEGWLPAGGPKSKARMLGKVLKGVDNNVDYTFIDCPPGLGPVTVNALSAADLALVVVEPSAFANNTMETVADLIDDVWDRFNPALDLGGIILNRQPAISREADARVEQLGAIVGKRSIWKPTVPQRVIVNEALGARRPIHSFGARATDVTETFDALFRKLERTVKAA